MQDEIISLLCAVGEMKNIKKIEDMKKDFWENEEFFVAVVGGFLFYNDEPVGFFFHFYLFWRLLFKKMSNY